MNENIPPLREYLIQARSTGRLDDNLFAVDLTKVQKLSYDEAREFFDRTELVESLKEMAKLILARVSGKESYPAYLLDTRMGGGKSHAMAYIYLLLKYKGLSVRDEVKDILAQAEVKMVPEVELCVLDGLNMDSSLSFIDQPQVKSFFNKGDSKEKVKESLDSIGKPVVIFIDEILQYLSRRADRAGTDMAHIRTLLEAIVDSQNSVIVISVPEDDPNKAGYREISDFFKPLARKAKIIYPQGEADFVRIAKKQLFQSIDIKKAKEATNYVRDCFQKYGLTFNQDDENLYNNSYPFHPMLIDLVSKRLLEFPNFQRTRDALKILAGIVTDLEDMPTPFITLGEVKLNGLVKERLTSYSIYNIKNMEQILEEITSEKLSREDKRLATAVFLYSLHPKPEARGLTKTELSRALLTLPPDDFSKLADNYIHGKSYYMDFNYENQKYYFRETLSVIALIKNRAKDVNDIEKELRSLIMNISKEFENKYNGKCNVIFDVKSEKDLVEGKLNIIFVPLRYEPDMDKWARNYAQEKHLFNIDSEFRNSVILIYPRKDEPIANLEELAKQSIAAEELMKSTNDNSLRKSISVEKKKIENELISAFLRTYSSMLYQQRGNMKNDVVSPREMTNEAFVDSLIDRLTQVSKAFLDPELVNVDSFFEALMGRNPMASLKECYNNILRSDAIPFLPKSVFEEVVKDGVKNGIIGITDNENKLVDSIPSLSNNYYIIRGEMLEELKKKNEQKEPKSQAQIQGSQSPVLSPTLTPNGVIHTTIPSVQPVLKTIYVNGSKTDLEILKNFLTQVELTYSLNNLIKENSLSLTLEADGKIVLRTTIAKASQLKIALENLAKTFDDWKAEISVKINQQDLSSLEDRLTKAGIKWNEK
ncbi:hypothetical protein [Metallosphaera hakonensis]|uniref:Uncharacterized protein n=1 Tax=Metallosphaera hakonensis JCM 8857 = DSM 7519 TaxID=1293036 RepID=A0A2U9ITK6_9CREN|nr:hypothetical protein [Metallosphaera hakonensis]AWR99358.1 hypothetical protein DFR87_06150 [Metallosphaera hakonensis JCM 8857 = DSM 7519]